LGASTRARAWYILPLGLGTFASGARVILDGGLPAFVITAGGIAAAGTTVTLLALFMHNASYSASPNQLRHSNIFGRQRTWPRAYLDRVVMRTVNIGQGPLRRCIFLSSDGTDICTIPTQIYDPAAVTELCEVLGLGIDENPVTLTGRQLRAEFPTIVSWREANALWVGLGIAFVIVVGAGVGVLLVAVLTGW
jgi:hypothetical protein